MYDSCTGSVVDFKTCQSSLDITLINLAMFLCFLDSQVSLQKHNLREYIALNLQKGATGAS